MTLIPEKWLAAIRSLGRPGRELAFLLLGLVLGAVLMPALIWLAGSVVLGPYANGGFGAFCSDLLGGLREAGESRFRGAFYFALGLDARIMPKVPHLALTAQYRYLVAQHPGLPRHQLVVGLAIRLTDR